MRETMTEHVNLEIMTETVKTMKDCVSDLEREENRDVISTKLKVLHNKCDLLTQQINKLKQTQLRYESEEEDILTEDDYKLFEKKCLAQNAPRDISDKLAIFLGKPIGTKMGRIEITYEVNKYILKHKLQDPHNGQKINPDNKLAELLNLPNSVQLTYFNLQRFINPHCCIEEPKDY